MVGQWLESYMLRGQQNAAQTAKAAAAWFADYDKFKSHARRVSRLEAAGLGLKIINLEDEQALQDAVLSVHHACAHTFSSTGAVKLIENQHGHAFLRIRPGMSLTLQPGGPPQPSQVPGTPSTRAERRRQGR